MHSLLIPGALVASAVCLSSSVACAGQVSHGAGRYVVDGPTAPEALGSSAPLAPFVSSVPSASSASSAPREPVRLAASSGNLGGGFIEFVFGGGARSSAGARYEPYEPAYRSQPRLGEGAATELNPKFLPQVVDYAGSEGVGTIVIDTPQKYLYLVQGDGKALRYGIGVGRPGFTWSGVKRISAKREWPDWVPPPEMLRRRPDLPSFMTGGPENPLGARALYLGSTLYRIHGSNEPWTIGTEVSSGCIRMRNQDVIDLYGRVKVGTKVVVI